jgi:hypothetical protein
MKKKLILMLFVLAALGSWAQMVKPFTVNSTGGTATLGGNTYEWSFAEMTLVNTTAASNLIVTQGLLQPLDLNVGTTELTALPGGLKVYPSPTFDLLNLETSFDLPGQLNYQVMDMAGKVVLRNELKLESGSTLTSLSLEPYPAGEYLLRVLFISRAGTGNFNQTFKIQKLQ